MDIHLNTIQFEVTRRCNDNCIHCCRGEAQNLDLSKDVIDVFFDNNKIVYINRLLLSGGEPTLAPKSLEMLVNKIIEKNIHVNVFEFSINGLIYNEEFVKALSKLNDYCLSLKDSKAIFGGTIWISTDQFHKAPSQEVLDKYEKLSFFVPYTAHKSDMKEEDILPVGRALENNLSNHKLDTSLITERGIEYKQGIHNGREYLAIPYLYVSSNGNVQNDYGSMYSYDLIDTYSFGNVLNQSLEDIITRQKEIKVSKK